MSIDIVREHLKKWNRDNEIMEFEVSTATVELAAKAVGCIPAEIAKTISLKNGESCILLVAAGDTKVDNQKFKNTFGFKARMLNAQEAFKFTGYKVGGICPFGIDPSIKIYLDESLKRFDYVYPACGTSNTTIKLTCDELFEFSGAAGWVDACKDWEQSNDQL